MVSSTIVNVLAVAGLLGLILPMLYFVWIGIQEDAAEAEAREAETDPS